MAAPGTGTGNGGEIRQSRFVAISQMMQPLVMFGLVFAAVEMATFTGLALLWNKIDGPTFLAIANGVFGLIGGGAISVAASRAPQRATDGNIEMKDVKVVEGVKTTETIKTERVEPPPKETPS